MKPACERCGAPLLPETPAFTCTHACTFCHACTDSLGFRCPNCGGMLLDRRRASIVVATATEALAVHRAVPGVRIYETGVGLAKHAGPFGESGRELRVGGRTAPRLAQRHHSRTARGAASGWTDAAVRRRVERTPRAAGAPLGIRAGARTDAHESGDRERRRSATSGHARDSPAWIWRRD